MTRPTHVRLLGQVWQATPEYVRRDLLDPLARYMLEAIADGPKISTLLRSFGLPPRLIQDVLGELVRLDLARIRLSQGTIVPTGRTAPLRMARLGRTIDLWQDAVTGAVLEFDQVRAYRDSRGGTSFVNLGAPDARVEPLDRVSHGQIIGMLDRAQSRHLQDADGGRLERLVDLVHSEQRSIYLPLDEVSFPDGPVLWINAPDVPAWVLRAWNRVFAARQRREAGRAPFFGSALGARQGRSPFPVLAEHVAAWQEAIIEGIRRQPPPQTAGELAPAWRAHENLSGRLRRRVLARLVPVPVRGSGRRSWLDPVVAAARSWVIAAVPTGVATRPLQALEDALRTRARQEDGVTRRHLRLWLLHDAVEGDTFDAAVLHRVREAARPAKVDLIEVPLAGRTPGLRTGVVAVADGQRAWLGHTGGSPGPTQLLQLDGDDAVAALLGALQDAALRGLAGADDLAGAVAELRELKAVPRLPGTAPEDVVGGADQGEPAPGPLQLLVRLRSRVLDGVVAAEDLTPAPAAKASGHQPLPEPEQRLGKRRTTLRSQPLQTRDPGLKEAIDEIVAKLALEGHGPLASWAYAQADELEDLLWYALGGGPGGTCAEVMIASPTLGALSRSEDFVGRLKAVVTEGRARVLVAWGTTGDPAVDRDSTAAAHALREAVPDVRLALRRTDGAVPVAAVAVDSSVAIGLVDWLDDPRRGWGACLFESDVLRAELLRLLEGAQTLSKLS